MSQARSKIVAECPKCRAPHNEHRLTCRRCGQYMNVGHGQEDLPANSYPVLVLILVALLAVGGAAFYFMKMRSQQAPVAQQTITTTATQTATDTAQTSAPKRKSRRHRHH